MIGLITSLDDAPVVEAFVEECGSQLVVLDSLEAGNITELTAVYAATPAMVELAETLQHKLGLRASGAGSVQQRTQRFNQQCALGPVSIPQATLIASETGLAEFVRAQSLPVVVRPVAIGDADKAVLLRHDSEVGSAYRDLANISGEVFAAPWMSGERYSVDLVTFAGRPLVADMRKLRIDEIKGQLLLRHRVSVHDGDPIAESLAAIAFRAVEAIGIVSGAAHVDVVVNADRIYVEEIVCAPRPFHLGVDAAFTAYSHSFHHLLVEALVRSDDFDRRFVRKPRRNRETLACAPLRVFSARDAVSFAGLRFVRRLPGFHSFVRAQSAGKPLSFGSIVGTVSFVSTDAASIMNSLTVLHEMEETDVLFDENAEIVG